MVAAGTALTQYSSISALAAATTGYYWDPVQQLTHVKLASSGSVRSVVLSGVDKAGYEAEFGTATGTTTNTNHAAYTGTGFVDGFETVGDAVTTDVSAAVTGTHALKFRYSNGSGTSATRTVLVDGVSVGTLTLPPTANWDTWGTATLSTSLTVGKRSVKLSYASGNATGINYDNLVVARP